jgi:hypothetical protein
VRRLAPLCLLPLLLACASGATTRSVTTQEAATPRVLGADDHRARRTLGGAPLTRYLSCGDSQLGPNAATYEILLDARTQLLSEPGGATTVRTAVRATARSPHGSGAVLQCSSTGALEARVAAELTTALRGR